jgi:hypothetical protein
MQCRVSTSRVTTPLCQVFNIHMEKVSFRFMNHACRLIFFAPSLRDFDLGEVKVGMPPPCAYQSPS